MNLEMKKEAARKEYIEARSAWLENPTNENWIELCNAKINCRRFGVRV